MILESTSPVGATEQLARWLADERPDLSFPRLMERTPIFGLHIALREFFRGMWFASLLKMIESSGV